MESGHKLAMRKYYILAFGIAGVYFVTYGAYGLAFWYGSELIGDGKCTPGSVFTVFFSVMAGAFSLGNALPFVNAVSTAIGAASTIFGIIDRVPEIDSYSKDGMTPMTVFGKIQFKGVNFVYPSRPDVKVLKNFSVDIEPGKKVALVGSSGAGKSTVVGLLMRFYDPISGKINLDGVDIRSLNLHWLRSQIGLVSQEPVLFGTTIAENIRYGREDVTLKEIQNAAELANAHGFISSLPLVCTISIEGYDTLVGERGAQLSGGQKQRIAIARALVRDPKVLLLDEATSALDSHSEGVVQEALEKAMAGRTTIIIAHRLSTIRNADVIYAMKNGDIVEWGSHNELMANTNLYYTLVMTQTAIDDDENEAGEGTEDDDVKVTAGGDDQVHCSENHSCIETEKGISRERKKRISYHSSLSSIHGDPELDRLEEEVRKERDFSFSFWRLFLLNQPEWSSLSVGLIGCCLCGAIMPVFAYFYGEIFAVASTSAAREQLKYGIAGGIAEEVLSSIRTVTSFGGQPREVQRYVLITIF
ncbi:hypothetical protein J437_LFUL001421 [Ladona fulva]|uniref:Uncharacterized protein n=1 Tax=Ladona fulva TaxID=123851 RepID=A0A8K0JXU7_LADFU|nr:hypothetical protein J437_LFUL001421 [Ladona fulva]